MAGARKVKGSGRVHCVDSFDVSGDAFSIPIYRKVLDSVGVPVREQFDKNVQAASLSDWIVVHQADAGEFAKSWTEPIDLLFMDADHSCSAALAHYEAWSRFLKPGGILAVHNTLSRSAGHDGSRRLVAEKLRSPDYTGITRVSSTTVARKQELRPASIPP